MHVVFTPHHQILYLLSRLFFTTISATDKSSSPSMTNSSSELRMRITQISRNAVSLRSLDPIPGVSKHYELPPENNSSQFMSIERERDIVSNLAFLAATTDDPLRVSAVCLEERPDNQGIVIRIASNNGDLLEVREGFRRIAGALECAASQGI